MTKVKMVMRLLRQYLPCLALTLLVAIVGEPCRAQDAGDVAKMIHAPPAELLNRPPHSLPPARILTASGAAGAKANSCILTFHEVFAANRWQ
jgi:hypothetical protein